MHSKARLSSLTLALLALVGTTVAPRPTAARRPFEGPGVIPVEAFVENSTNDTVDTSGPVMVQSEVAPIDPTTPDQEGVETYASIEEPVTSFGFAPKPGSRSAIRLKELEPENGRRASRVRQNGHRYFTTAGARYRIDRQYRGKVLVVGARGKNGHVGRPRRYTIR